MTDPTHHFRYILALFLFLLAGGGLLPGSAQAQERIVLTDRTQTLRIGTSVYYLEDKDRSVSFEQARSAAYASRYRKIEQEAPNFGNVELRIWNRFTVVNRSSRQWLLVVDNYSLDTLRLYYPDGKGSYRQVTSGRAYPFSNKKYRTGNFVFDLPLQSGDSAVFYLSVDSYFMQYPLIVTTAEGFIARMHRSDMLSGFYFGFLLLILGYNFFIYLSERDRRYLYYMVYVLLSGVMVAQLKGYTAELAGERFHFLWQYAPAIIALSGVTALVFTKQTLETKRNAPNLHWIINRVLIPVSIGIMILSLLGFNLAASVINQVMGLFSLLFMYTTAIIVYRRGFRAARFYIAACCFYFLGVIIYVLKAFAILPFTLFTDNAIELGSSVEMMLFSLALGDKLNLYKKDKLRAQDELVQSLRENERLIVEQNKILEVKVKERTRELHEAMEQLEEQNGIISREKERSDNLLLNILPYETAKELKEKGSAEPRLFEEVTIMFTDFKDYTRISEHLSPRDLVTEIDACFKAFDEITGRHGIEKIKTIGDSYMAAGGLPVPNSTHAADVVQAALEIRDFMERYNSQRSAAGNDPIQLRIGIHTGSVVAGIVGWKKFAYDIWGDSVNTASRMESSGEVGKINISGATYERISGVFRCTHRGKVQAKNKGLIDMYFVDAPVAALALAHGKPGESSRPVEGRPL